MQNIRVNIEEVRSVNNNIESARSELIKMRNSLLQDLEQLSRYVLSSKVTDLIRTIQGKNADLTDGISVDISQCCSFLEARMNEYMVSEEDTTNRIISSVNKMDEFAQGILTTFGMSR